MTELSPAAQAVLDAANGVCMYRPDCDDTRLAAAATLRAAAKELAPSRKLEPGYIFSAPAEHWYYEFRIEAEQKLLAIAAELEAQ